MTFITALPAAAVDSHDCTPVEFLLRIETPLFTVLQGNCIDLSHVRSSLFLHFLLESKHETKAPFLINFSN